MFAELTIIWLVLLFPLVAALSLTTRPYVLLLLGLVLVFVPRGDWQLAGARLDPTDLILLGIAAAVAAKRFGRNSVPDSARPYLKAWLALGVLVSAAYVAAPINQEHLTDPLRGLYQVLRYCWKPIAYYPLVLLLIGNDRNRLNAAFIAIIVAGDILALQATIQGYSGEMARGPFFAGNALGGALVVPIILALARFIYPRSRRDLLFAAGSLALLGRGLLFSSSRGALVATVAAGAVFFALLIRTGGGRRRFGQLVVVGAMAVVMAFIVKPDLLERPNVKHILTAIQGTSDANMQWRMTERWPHFWAIVMENPWLGTGLAVDLDLSDQANTPHSGYIALSMVQGLPAAALMVGLGVLALLHGVWVFRRRENVDERLFGACVTAGLAGIFVHNIVESTLLLTFHQQLYWTLIALISALRFAPKPATAENADEAAQDQPSEPAPLPRRPVRMITYGGGH